MVAQRLPTAVGNPGYTVFVTIEWNAITWYSRIATIVVFIGILPILNFYIGLKYQETTQAIQQSVEAQDQQDLTYQCPKPADATAAAGASATPQ